jgi:hypothetical protein
LTKSIDRAAKKVIIEKALDSINIVKTKTYVSNSFAISLNNEKDVPIFEKELQTSITKSMNKYLEDQKLDPKQFNRTISYTINNTDKNVIVTF